MACLLNRGGPTVVLLTITIGVLNICLGYALAVCLGWGPPSFAEGWDAISVDAAGGTPRDPAARVHSLAAAGETSSAAAPEFDGPSVGADVLKVDAAL
jgi:hypothetical protein